MAKELENKTWAVEQNFEEAKEIVQWSIDTDLIKQKIVFRSYLLSHLQKVYSLYEDTYFKTFIDAYKAYHLDETDRQKELEEKWWDWRTNIRYPLTKMVIDTLFANFYDTEITYKIQARDPEWYDKTKLVQWFFEWIMDISWGNNELFKAAKEAMITWTSFIKVVVKKDIEEWRYLKEVKNWKRIYETYKNEKVYPSIKNVDVFSLFIDPAANDIDSARFVFHRKILPYKEAFEKYWRLLWINLTDEERNTILKSPQYVSHTDYSKIKRLPFFKWDIQEDLENFNWQNFFEVYYFDNDLIEVIEYYEHWKLLILFNWYIVYDDVTIYPFKWYPFTKVNYELDNWWLYTKWIWTNLEQFQKISDILLNSYLDQVKLNVAPMYEADKGSVNVNDIWEDWSFQYEPFKIIFKRDEKQAIKPIPLTNWDQLWLQALQQLQQYVEFSEGPNQYTMWWSPVERSATGASLKANITKQRLKPLVDSINRALSEVSEKILLLAATIYKNKIPVRVLWEDGSYKFKMITPQEIIWQYDIIFESNSLKQVIKEVERNQLIQFISQALPAANDPVRQRSVVDIMKLFRELVTKFDLPEDIILTDEDFKKIIASVQANTQLWQEEAKQKVEQYLKTKYKKNVQPEQNIVEKWVENAETLVNVAKQEPNPWAGPTPEKELNRELWWQVMNMQWWSWVSLWDILAQAKRY